MQYIMFVLGIVFALLIWKAVNKYNLFNKYNKYVVLVVMSLLIAVVLEIFTFNYSAFAGKKTEHFALDIATDNGQWDYDEGNNVINKSTAVKDFKSENNNGSITYTEELEINSVVSDIDVILDTTAKTVEGQLYYKDQSLTTEYSKIGIDDWKIIKGMPASGHIKTHFAGKTSMLKILLKTDEDNGIKNIRIKVNYSKNFNFNLVRVLLLTLLMAFIGVIYFSRNKKQMGLKMFTVVLLIQMAFILGLFMINNATFDENGKYTGENYSSEIDVYNELTLALAQGKVDLNGVNTQSKAEEQEEIEALQKLDNPYEWKQRAGMVYKWDRAFYNGKYYCYFGIVPVLFIYLPIYLITGILISTKYVSIFLILLTVIMMYKLALTIADKWYRKVNPWIVLGTMACFVNVSMLLYCVNGAKFYEVATVSALACALGGIDCIINAFEKNKTKKKLLLAGAILMALSVGCRPNFALASFMVLPLVLNGLAKSGGFKKTKGKRKNLINYIKAVFSKKNITAIVVFAVPYVIIGLGLMYYNYIRFGSIAEFGAKYQLTVYDTSYYKMTDLSKLPIAIARGLLMPPTVNSVFPYINAVAESSNYAGYLYGISYVGILANPIMWLIVMLPWSLKRGIKKSGYRGFAIAGTVMGLFMCFFTTAMGGISLRYWADFAWMLFIPVIFVIFDLYTRAKERKIEKYMFSFLGVLVCATVIMHMLMIISPSCSSLNNAVPEIFYRLQQMVVFWK